MTKEERIKKILSTDIFASIIEIGAGMPVTHSILNFEGASKIIFECKTFYNKNSQQKFLNKVFDDYKSVSFDAVNAFLLSEKNIIQDENINTFFITSFQIGKDKCNHGWVAYSYKDKTYFYHLTFSLGLWENRTREDVINFIGRQLERLLLNRNKENCFISQFIDIIIKKENNRFRFCSDFLISQSSFFFHPFNIEKNKKAEEFRLETALRKEKRILIYKGSFNPITLGHIKIAETIQKKYKAKVFFLINIMNYDKGKLNKEDILKRVKYIHNCGFDVILSHKSRFLDDYDVLKNRGFEKVHFIMGEDIAVRLLETEKIEDLNNSKIKWLLFNRKIKNRKTVKEVLKEKKLKTPKNMVFLKETFFHSSTDARKIYNKIKNDIKNLEQIIPKKIVKDLLF